MVPAEPRNLASPVRLTGGLAWKLNRLRCMTPAEIGHRVVKAAAMRAERWGFAGFEVPAADLSILAKPWIHTEVSVNPLAYAAAADRVVAGRFDVFALDDVDLGNPPRWNRDPKTGIEAPLEFGKQLDYRDAAIVGDCKYLWEPNRHLHLVTLAQAYALSGDEKYTAALRAHVESWIEQCPFRMGVNWSSSLEAGLRLMNWALAWQLVGGVEAALFKGSGGMAFRDRWLVSIYQHAEFVLGHFSLHSSANNHLMGEAAGLFCASLAWPHWPRARHWQDVSGNILEREALLQNAPDGVNREQATSYQQFTFDLMLFPFLAARANGREMSAAYRGRLESMLEFLASIMDAGGHLPMFGDADDAHVALLDPRAGFDRYRSSLATGAVLFRRGELKVAACALDDKTRWLLGDGAERAFTELAAAGGGAPIRQEFPDGGYYILGCDFGGPREIRLVADAGALGYREIAAHGHADALSFTLSVGGEEMLIDPGTFAYHTEPEWRAYFRGTSAHNTLVIDGLDQSEPGGNFMWLRKARAACTSWMTSAAQDTFEGCHDGYAVLPDPVIHCRRITLDKKDRSIALEDTLEMKGEHRVELFLHCAEGSVVSPIAGGFRVTRLDRSIEIHWPDLPQGRAEVRVGTTAPIGGWVSRRFDRKEAAPTLVWSAVISGEKALHTRIQVQTDYVRASGEVMAGQLSEPS